MRRLVILVALILPLIGAALEQTPSAAACRGAQCIFQHCELHDEPPTVDIHTLETDLGNMGVECNFPPP